MFRVLFLFLILIAGCQKSTTDISHTLKINLGMDPQTLDPRKARDLSTITLMHMVFEGLTRTSRTGDVEMALAKGVEISEDGLQYVFHLRKSHWSNGDLVTSADFAHSWKSILDPHFPTDVAYQLYPIKNAHKIKIGELEADQLGVLTPDPQTLVVQLEQPIPYFLEALSLSIFFPVPHQVVTANPDWALDPSTHVCNGPFSIKSWKHSDQLQVEKNPHYWEAKEVKLEGIDLYMVASDTEIRMFEEGKLNWAGSPLSVIPIDAVAKLKEMEKLQVSPLCGTYFFRVNTEKKPLSNASFRRALAIAIDREGIAEHILQGGQAPAKSLVPPQMDLSKGGYFPDCQQETAYSLLMEALLELDLTMENLGPIAISYCSSERNASIAQAIQKQWEETLDLHVELEAVEPKVFFQRLSKKEYQLAAGSWTADFNDPINFLEVFKYKEASTNNTNWESSKYIDLLNRSTLCRDVNERKQILREAEQILMDQMPIIPVFHFALNYLQQEELKEVVLSPIGQVDFRWAEIR
ncbi:MAG TPA: peptide ABC transporter substrate-binding protein [Chlamydiales bacterium]|nr:peptide ABC transporter substrate-binding protein [Chlamydiales bacterium]